MKFIYVILGMVIILAVFGGFFLLREPADEKEELPDEPLSERVSPESPSLRENSSESLIDEGPKATSTGQSSSLDLAYELAMDVGNMWKPGKAPFGIFAYDERAKRLVDLMNATDALLDLMVLIVVLPNSDENYKISLHSTCAMIPYDSKNYGIASSTYTPGRILVQFFNCSGKSLWEDLLNMEVHNGASLFASYH